MTCATSPFDLAVLARSFFCQSFVDLSAILYSEVICAWLIVSLLSNSLIAVEAKLLSLAQLGASGAAGGGAVAGPSTSSSSAAPLLSSHSTSTGLKTLQQQQHFKNYQSINMEEALP